MFTLQGTTSLFFLCSNSTVSEQRRFIVAIIIVAAIVIMVILVRIAARAELGCAVSSVQVGYWMYNCIQHPFKEDKTTTDVVQLVPPVRDMLNLYHYFST